MSRKGRLSYGQIEVLSSIVGLSIFIAGLTALFSLSEKSLANVLVSLGSLVAAFGPAVIRAFVKAPEPEIVVEISTPDTQEILKYDGSAANTAHIIAVLKSSSSSDTKVETRIGDVIIHDKSE